MLSVEGLKLYNAKELAEMLDTQVVTIRSYINSRKLRAQKIAGKWYIASSNLQAFLKGETPGSEPKKERFSLEGVFDGDWQVSEKDFEEVKEIWKSRELP